MGLLPFATATVYQRGLLLLGHKLPVRSLWLTAIVSIFLSIALPAGPVVMSAFLLRAFRQRGVPEGVTTVAVAMDTLTYQAVFFGVVGLGLGYLLTEGELTVRQITQVALLALAVLIIGLYLWGLQRDRADLTAKVVKAQQWLAKVLRRTWQPQNAVRFIDELYEGKQLIGTKPTAILGLLALQALAISFDILAFYCAFAALGVLPKISVVILCFALANFFSSIAPLPGGGGSFEATAVLIASQLGIAVEIAVGATLIFRVLSFWLPLLVTAVSYHRILRDR